MPPYWIWFEIELATDLNAHLRYLAETLIADDCLNILYLDPPVEITVHKRCFTTKPAQIEPLIRTSSIGRDQLANIQKRLETSGYELKLRRSSKKKLLNQIKVPLAIDDPMYTLKVRQILETVALEHDQSMPDKAIIGYQQHRIYRPLPGTLHFAFLLTKLGYVAGNSLGRLLSWFKR
ncbi:MAG: hypothetical protein AAGI15_16345 [Pseudomonadota bacterium]